MPRFMERNLNAQRERLIRTIEEAQGYAMPNYTSAFEYAVTTRSKEQLKNIKIK